MSDIFGYCSWCYKKAKHKLVEKNLFSRNSYRCSKCGNGTVQCRFCSHMAKGKPSEKTLADIKLACKFSKQEHAFLNRMGEINSFTADLTQNWHNELCAEHDGAVASFEALSTRLSDIADYKVLFERKQRNLSKLAKNTANAGALIGLFLASGGGAAVSAALGRVGLLGAVGVGTKAASLEVLGLASLTVKSGIVSASGSSGIVVARGATLGNVLGGVLAQKFRDGDVSFGIKKLKNLDDALDQTIFINGFTQKNETDFYDWQLAYLSAGLRHKSYGVNWDSESNESIGRAFAEGVQTQSAIKMLEAIAHTGSVQVAKKMSPFGWGRILVQNPWHSAMIRAATTGELLADCIARTDGQKFNLVGHSLGCRVIFYALLALGSKAEKYIKDVILLGGAVGKDDIEGWHRALSTIDGTVYNCYSKEDSVLQVLYQCGNAFLSKPIGFYPISISSQKLVNLDCTDVVKGHMKWKDNFSEILKRIY